MRDPIAVGIIGIGYGQHVLAPAFAADERCQVAVNLRAYGRPCGGRRAAFEYSPRTGRLAGARRRPEY